MSGRRAGRTSSSSVRACNPAAGGSGNACATNADKVSDGCKQAFQAARAANPRAAKVREACSQDVKQLCPGVQPGDGRIRQCLRANADKVSDGCKQAFQAARAAKQGQ